MSQNLSVTHKRRTYRESSYMEMHEPQESLDKEQDRSNGKSDSKTCTDTEDKNGSDTKTSPEVNDKPTGPMDTHAGAQINTEVHNNTYPRVEGDLHILCVLDCGCEVMTCQFNSDGSLLAVGLSNGTIKVYNVDNGRLVKTLRDSDSIRFSLPVTALRFTLSSQSRSLLVASYASGNVKCWYVWGRECVWTVREAGERDEEEGRDVQRQTLSLSTSHSGEKIATGGSDSAIHLYDLHTHQRLLTYSASSTRTVMDGHKQRVFAVTFHPDREREFISGGWDNTVHFWDTRQQHSVRMLSGPHICGESLQIDPMDGYILSGSWRKEKALEIWDYASGQKIREVPSDPHGQSKVYTCHWLGQDHIVAAGSQPNMLTIIDHRSLLSMSKLLQLPSAVFSSCVCPRGKWMGLIAATSGSRVFLLDRTGHKSRKQDFTYSSNEEN